MRTYRYIKLDASNLLRVEVFNITPDVNFYYDTPRDLVDTERGLIKKDFFSMGNDSLNPNRYMEIK